MVSHGSQINGSLLQQSNRQLTKSLSEVPCFAPTDTLSAAQSIHQHHAHDLQTSAAAAATTDHDFLYRTKSEEQAVPGSPYDPTFLTRQARHEHHQQYGQPQRPHQHLPLPPHGNAVQHHSRNHSQDSAVSNMSLVSHSVDDASAASSSMVHFSDQLTISRPNSDGLMIATTSAMRHSPQHHHHQHELLNYDHRYETNSLPRQRCDRHRNEFHTNSLPRRPATSAANGVETVAHSHAHQQQQQHQHQQHQQHHQHYHHAHHRHYAAQSHGSIELGVGCDSLSTLDLDAAQLNDVDDAGEDDDRDEIETSTYDQLPLGRPIPVSAVVAATDGTLQRRLTSHATIPVKSSTTPSDEYCSTCDESETDTGEDSHHDEDAIDEQQQTDAAIKAAADDSNESEKEIFIDFKPRISPAVSPRRLQQQHHRRKRLQKQLSEGELIHQQRQEMANNTKNRLLAMASASEKDLKASEAETATQPRTGAYEYRDQPIVDEGVCEKCAPPTAGQAAAAAAAAANERRQAFRKRSVSMEGSAVGAGSATPTTTTTTGSEADDDDERDMANGDGAVRSKQTHVNQRHEKAEETHKVPHTKPRSPPSPFMDELSVVSRAQSNYPSTDSLANDLTRDHSDGIWNESQATVLHADRR